MKLNIKLPPTSPLDYVSRFASELKLTNNTVMKTREILRQADEHEILSGRNPTTMAAAAIYVASIITNDHRTQREVADVAGVTEVSIRNRYKELIVQLGIELDFGSCIRRRSDRSSRVRKVIQQS